MIEIPLNSNPEQIFNINLRGQKYDVRVILNSRTSTWSIDLSVEGKDILNGVPLVSGVDIFSQHNIPVKNTYVVNLDNPSLDPSKSNLGGASRLFVLEESEVPDGASI